MTTAVVLSERAAKTLTERIRKAGEDFGALLLEAHDGEAWRVMGYATWQDYIAGEFTFTARRSFQLLDEARISKAVGGPVTATEARAVKREILHEVKRVSLDEAIEVAPSDTVKRLLEEQREAERTRVPNPKPKAKRGGYVPPADRLRSAFRLIVEVNEEMAAEDSLPPDLLRAAQSAYVALGAMLASGGDR